MVNKKDIENLIDGLRTGKEISKLLGISKLYNGSSFYLNRKYQSFAQFKNYLNWNIKEFGER